MTVVVATPRLRGGFHEFSIHEASSGRRAGPLVRKPPRVPSRIQWDSLSDEDLDAMPILKQLRRRRKKRHTFMALA